MENDLMDQALRVSQAQRETFAFQVVKGQAIDGGVMGSKVKFVNHAEGDDENCLARTERYRGEARIALKAKKPIKPGEELFFNYAIIDEGGDGNQWLMGGDLGTDESSDDEEGEERGSGSADEDIGFVERETEEEDAVEAEHPKNVDEREDVVEVETDSENESVEFKSYSDDPAVEFEDECEDSDLGY